MKLAAIFLALAACGGGASSPPDPPPPPPSVSHTVTVENSATNTNALDFVNVYQGTNAVQNFQFTPPIPVGASSDIVVAYENRIGIIAVFVGGAVDQSRAAPQVDLTPTGVTVVFHDH